MHTKSGSNARMMQWQLPLAAPLLEPSGESEESCDTLGRLAHRGPEWCNCQDLIDEWVFNSDQTRN